jgi:AraC-like DNA-binding protein
MEVRLRHALAWLLDSAEPVAQIAAGAGFASQAHLTTRFLRRFGVTPAACRRQGRIGAARTPERDVMPHASTLASRRPAG